MNILLRIAILVFVLISMAFAIWIIFDPYSHLRWRMKHVVWWYKLMGVTIEVKEVDDQRLRLLDRFFGVLGVFVGFFLIVRILFFV